MKIRLTLKWEVMLDGLGKAELESYMNIETQNWKVVCIVAGGNGKQDRLL